MKPRAAYDSLSGEVYTHLPDLASRRLDNLVVRSGGQYRIRRPNRYGKCGWCRTPIRDGLWPVPVLWRVAFAYPGSSPGQSFHRFPSSRIGLSIGSRMGPIDDG